MEAAPKPDGAPEATPAKAELPTVESPPISPGTETPAVATDTPEPAIEPIVEVAPAIELIALAAHATRRRFVVRPRQKRYALLAVSVTFAAAIGAVVGALASGAFSAPARSDVAAVEQNKEMQQSIARLSKEITTLKVSLEQANKSAHTQFAKIFERLEHATAEITGSISAPQTTVPLPAPRPVPRITATEPPPPTRVAVVPGWAIRDTRNGYVYVENHGEIYQVALGVPLPGLGPVQSVKRQDGRWIVLTPKGIIVSMRDRRHFEEF
jgi:hypothetical protein